ncbi:MAG TPA: CopD family protein [Kofleriaceae bacterium]|nr:CopD family protein [Kofleriaceae bacterium]
MSQQLLIYNSVKAIHVLGFLLWIGSMFALTLVLQAHARGGATQGALVGVERSLGRAMELGALLAIACGVYMLLRSPAAISPLKQPYVHIKLTVVVVLIAMHGLVRAKMAKLGRGQGTGPGSWVSAAVLILAVAAIWLAVVKPMLRV